MKGIAIFVALLLSALGVLTYVYTRPPDRTLSPTDRTWAAHFRSWTGKHERLLDAAYTGLGDSVTRNATLLDPLLTCFATLVRVGEPPGLMRRVEEAARAACGETQYAIQLNDRYETASLASTKRHLYQAEDWLRLARSRLRDQLERS